LKWTKILWVVILLAANSGASWSQKQSGDSLHNYRFPDFFVLDTQLRNTFPFIHFEANHFKFFSTASPNWFLLYKKFTSMVLNQNEKLNFYHIGGSHIQADLYTHDIRTYLQSHWNGLPGERGFVFPFSLTNTNNPANYKFTSSNLWTYYRNVTKVNPTLEFGLLGAVVGCSDSILDIHFNYGTTQVQPPFNQIKIFHSKGDFPFELSLNQYDSLIIKQVHNPIEGFTEIYLGKNIQDFDLKIVRTTPINTEFQLSAFQLKNEFPGIAYNAIGINGAAVWNYLDCPNFEEQLRESPPDFFAFSIGTNDANVPYADFNPEQYKTNLELLINKVLKTNPNCAILMTVPNDSYYHRSSLNRNIARQREVIIELAQQFQCPIWDFYGIMGELGSSKTWFRSGLMRDDLVHFTAKGYHLKGDLYFDAFLKWLSQMDALSDNNK
jgi:hypothetical protein